VTSPFESGVTTQAETLEEAFEMARDAIETLKVGRAKLLSRRSPAAKAPADTDNDEFMAAIRPAIARRNLKKEKAGLT